MKMDRDFLIHFAESGGEPNRAIILDTKSLISRAMSSKDTELLGAIFSIISDPTFRTRLSVPLTAEEYFDIYMRYGDLCILENPDSDLAHSRYEFGWEMVGYLAQMIDEEPLEEPERFFRWVDKKYLDGPGEVREMLVNACFDHLFEKNKYRKFYHKRWKNKPVFMDAYKMACMWGDAPGVEKLYFPDDA